MHTVDNEKLSAEHQKINKDFGHMVLTDDLGMHRVTAKFVSKLISLVQKYIVLVFHKTCPSAPTVILTSLTRSLQV